MCSGKCYTIRIMKRKTKRNIKYSIIVAVVILLVGVGVRLLFPRPNKGLPVRNTPIRLTPEENIEPAQTIPETDVSADNEPVLTVTDTPASISDTSDDDTHASISDTSDDDTHASMADTSDNDTPASTTDTSDNDTPASTSDTSDDSLSDFDNIASEMTIFDPDTVTWTEATDLDIDTLMKYPEILTSVCTVIDGSNYHYYASEDMADQKVTFTYKTDINVTGYVHAQPMSIDQAWSDSGAFVIDRNGTPTNISEYDILDIPVKWYMYNGTDKDTLITEWTNNERIYTLILQGEDLSEIDIKELTEQSLSD